MKNLFLHGSRGAIQGAIVPSPPASPADPGASGGQSAAGGRRRWRAGTLLYTSAGLAALCFWLLWGDFGFNIEDASAPTTVKLLLEQYHISDLAAGLLLGSLPQIMAIVLGPVVAYRSDRYRSRWGRRIPFLAAQAPLAVLAMAGLAFSPDLGGALHGALGAWAPSAAAAVILTIGVSWMTFKFCSIVGRTIFASLISDVVPHAFLGRFYALFRVVSLGAAITFDYELLGKVQQHLTLVCLGIGAVYGVSFAAMCLNVREGPYPPPEEEARTRGTEGSGPAARLARAWAAVKTYARDCVSNPFYRWFFISVALSYVATLPTELFNLFFALSLRLSMATYGKLAALQLGLSLLQSYPAGWLADRIHPLRMVILTLSLCLAASLAAFVFVHDAKSFAIAFVGYGTITGLWGTVKEAVPPLVFPQHRFGTLYSAMAAVNAVAIIVGGPVFGWTLDRLHQDYRYIYLFAAACFLPAVGGTLVVYRKFLAYGGPGGFRPPE
ncbi:MAG: MFS transporter [Opitutaceae bacterium]